MTSAHSPWAVVLAAGSGTRLNSLTQAADGAPVPKQYCSLADGGTLLEDALLRVRSARLRLGDEDIRLLEFITPAGRPIPVDMRANDRAFQHIAIIVSDMQAAYAHLRAHRVRHASTAPQRLPKWNTQAAGIEAFYFRDPDGHFLEIPHFPPGKGEARWQSDAGRLFLGIDHTAIVVADTGQSLAFYRDRLGLRITTLRAAHGPGVELLEYLTPGDGAPYPADSRANDVWHWQMEMRVAGPEHLEIESARPLSSRLTRTAQGRARMWRDPDRHAVLLTH
jgi:catechol 2,3-dioxygenase-like lactoylglutathione lyase family enzyme